MQKPLVWLGVVLCVAGIAGCVAVSATQLGDAKQLTSVPADQVRIYRTADQVPGKYEEVALLNASGSSSMTSENEMYRKMQEEAGKRGANAIILDAMSEPSAGAKVAAAIFGVDAERKGRAIAIYILPNLGSPGDTSVAR